MADQFPFQTTMCKWANIARHIKNENAAAYFDQYAATGSVEDSGLLAAIYDVTRHPLGLLANYGGELNQFSRHVRSVMRRNKIEVPAC